MCRDITIVKKNLFGQNEILLQKIKECESIAKEVHSLKKTCQFLQNMKNDLEKKLKAKNASE